MFYYLFQYLDHLNVPGAGVFKYISFRAASAFIFSLLISLVYGKRIINYLKKKQIGELVRDLGLEGQYQKKGTPTMGGIIIILAIVVPVLFLAKLENVYIILMLVTTLWLGALGFMDDYIKVFKKNKEGMPGKIKILGQVILGLIVALTLYFSQDVVVREKIIIPKSGNKVEEVQFRTIKSTKTTIPFVKDNEFDYAYLVGFMGKYKQPAAWVVFVLAVIFIITAVSNGANLTDGLDGLAAGTSSVVAMTLAFFAYVSGNFIISDYLNIMYIPHSGELVIFASALIGATVGFLWYNAFPAQVFMGDTGSLTLGGITAVFAIIIRKELLIPLFCGIFLAESLSVIMQVSYFKYTKRKYGEGRRIFKMSPLHHHFQKLGYTEPKIVTRFWIVAIMLAVLTIVTLKLR